MSIENKLLKEIKNKLDQINDYCRVAAKSDDSKRVLLLTDVNDELSEVLLNFEDDPLAESFRNRLFNND